MTQTTPGPTDLPSLIAGILAEARALLHAEAQLARREVSDNLARAGRGLMLMVISVLVAFVGLSALAVAAILGVAALGIAYPWAALIVAIACLALALLLALIGRSRLSAASLAPNRTLRQVRSDIRTAKEMAHVARRSA